MANQTGIAIVIKAFLPTGKSLDDQFAALTIVKAAHESGDYTEVLKAAQIDEVKAEQKTRRVDSPPKASPEPEPEPEAEPEAGGEPRLYGYEGHELLTPEPQTARGRRRS